MSFMLKGTKSKNKKERKSCLGSTPSSFTKMDQIQCCPQGSPVPEGRPQTSVFTCCKRREET